jgi:hypothetical protein
VVAAREVARDPKVLIVRMATSRRRRRRRAA